MSNQLAKVSLVALFGFCLSSLPMHIGFAQTGARGEHGFAEDRSPGTFFVINSPSAASQGTDSILVFDPQGNSKVFFSARHNITGLRDIVCDPKTPHHVFVTHGVFAQQVSGFLIFNAFGQMDVVPSGTPGDRSLAFDRAGNLYSADSSAIFRNDRLFASLPFTGIGQLAVDGTGNLYLTDPPIASRLFRIDQWGHVTVFADASSGLNHPYGVAVDSRNNIYVANNPGSMPASILKFDPSGTATSFATNISLQPGIRSMTFDHHDNLYATLQNDNTIVKFDRHGHSAVFATANDGLNFPAAITVGNCPVELNEREHGGQLSRDN